MIPVEGNIIVPLRYSQFVLSKTICNHAHMIYSYTYYTALPEEFAERQCTPEHPPIDSKPPKVKEKQQRFLETKNTLQGTSSSELDPLPMVTVKTDRPKKHKKAPIEEEMEMDFEQSKREDLPLKSNMSNQQLLLQRQASRTFFHSKSIASRPKRPPLRSNSRPSSQKGVKVSSRYLPHTTISMRRSGEKGGAPFSYGAGLQEQSSVTVMNIETT